MSFNFASTLYITLKRQSMADLSDKFAIIFLRSTIAKNLGKRELHKNHAAGEKNFCNVL